MRNLKRWWVTGVLAVAATMCSAQPITSDSDPVAVPSRAKAAVPSTRILLIPLDDRPAATQFAQMIGSIADVMVDTPPASMLGRFTVPGQPDRILDWLASKDLAQYDCVIASVEMVCYGGLIASRTDRTSMATAQSRIERLAEIRARAPKTRFFGFSALQRLAPTALKTNRSWNSWLAQFVVFKASLTGAPSKADIGRGARFRAKIPAGEIDRYYAVRKRNHSVQMTLLDQVRGGAFDYLIIGQDDAQPKGPHVAESKRLEARSTANGTTDKVYFCEGIDQHANVLLSRALLQDIGWVPRVRVIYADAIAKGLIAPYESDHVEASLSDQVIASGGQLTTNPLLADYSLYVNTPNPRPAMFENFVRELQAEVDQGFPVAVADINLGASGTGDPRLFDALNDQARSMRLLAYAGWNTAGNTMGTTIPAANVYLLARRSAENSLARELNQRTFILHRLVNDFEYHRFTRPAAYKLQSEIGGEREETYGSAFDALNDFVKRDMSERLTKVFESQFRGRRFFAGTRQYEFRGIDGVQVELPWPRAYEVRIGFNLQAVEVAQ
jgi:hypothetical protein